MTASHLENALAEAAEEVLETMFFATVMGEAADSPGEAGVAARVVFRGNPSGAVTVAACPEAARTLASAFLAIEEAEVSAEHAREVVCEMANMLCGSILSRLHPDTIFELLHPEAGRWDEETLGGAASRRFDIGARCVAVSLEIDQSHDS